MEEYDVEVYFISSATSTPDRRGWSPYGLARFIPDKEAAGREAGVNTGNAEHFFGIAENRTKALMFSNPWPSHYTGVLISP
jgi:hypothetical protein